MTASAFPHNALATTPTVQDKTNFAQQEQSKTKSDCFFFNEILCQVINQPESHPSKQLAPWLCHN